MSKQKKKVSSSSTSDAKAHAAMHRKRFLERIGDLCNAMVGPGYFEKIPSVVLDQMYATRYPALKIKAAPGSQVSKVTVIKANKLLEAFLKNQYIDLKNGSRVLLPVLLSEGLILLNFLHMIPGHYFPHAALLKEQFKEYGPESEGYEAIQEMLEVLVQDVTVFLSDLKVSILRADYSDTPVFDMYSRRNDIFIMETKTEKSTMVVRDKKREVVRLGWVGPEMEWIWVKVKPSALGFDVGSFDIPLDVYIQNHALDKLQERVDITPGIMHSIVFFIFNDPEINHVRYHDRTLVEYYVADQKVGYLHVELHGDKFLIHTFLFLTNNGTPEGIKLEKLAALEKEDKKHLEIDKLSTFNSYHIEKNEKLRKLFIEAGCESLLGLGHLQEFSAKEIKDKDPESILKYLSDSKYFKEELNEDEDIGGGE
ncbi:MAG: hypothetical protein EOO88_10190 [Pedobacter sp.]|nr:MAG: hypothetical protein EOO88_10190 [Pedobacter sp.]